MKKLRIYLSLLFVAFVISSCDKAEVLSLTDDASYPRIFCTWPEPDSTAGEELGSFSGQTDLEFNITIQYTPYEECEAVWYLDNVEYCRGATFTYLSGEPITHTLKVVVTSDQYETYREAYLNIVYPI